MNAQSNTEKIKQYLNHYVKRNNPQYAVFIKGKWGCGKTHFIKQLVKEYTEEKKEDFKIKPIYLSLYGISSIEQINSKMKRELFPLLYSKEASIAASLTKGVLKKATGIDLDDIPREYTDIGLYFLENLNENCVGIKLLIFDDLERCQIPVDVVFGYINQLVEHSECKVIIIGEEEKIKTIYEKSDAPIQYKDFKEKLIGQSFELSQNYEDIIRRLAIISNDKHVKIHINMINDLFHASGIRNLRIIKQCFCDFNRLVILIARFLQDKGYHPAQNKLDEFFKQILAYFLIAYCEYKSGHTSIIGYKSFNPDYYFQEESKAANESFREKYDNLLSQNNIHEPYHSFSIESIIDYIENGHIIQFHDVLSTSYLLHDRKEENWEKLWYYWDLDDEIFEYLKESVSNLLSLGQIKTAGITMHICGILLSLSKHGLYSQNRTTILSLCKKQVDRIVSTAPNNENLIENYNKGFHEEGSDEMKELVAHIESVKNKVKSSQRMEQFQEIWNNITKNNLLKLSSLFDEDFFISDESMYENLDAKNVAERISLIPNKLKRKVNIFFYNRYNKKFNQSLKGQLLKELPFLVDLKTKLELKNQQLVSISKFSLTTIIETLDKSIKEIEM